jgi:hypothetical protein
MDRLHLKCALMDLLEHNLVVLESEADVAAVAEAARKLGFEALTNQRTSSEPGEMSWVVTARRLHEESVEVRPERRPTRSAASADVGR